MGILPLKGKNGHCFIYNDNDLKKSQENIHDFLEDKDYMNSRLFSARVMFTHELKANNNIEGIKDEMTVIEEVIENAKSISNLEQRNRIINLYNGYKYIRSGQEITEENLAYLYQILSKDLLSEEDLSKMGDKYRQAEVFILQNGRLDGSWDTGLDYKLVPEYMKYFFDFVNTDDNKIDKFIRSQIMHFYFVYVHPYMDINGRTSRTVAMWYLLNNKEYPYIIFNRGINFDPKYDHIIRNCGDKMNITEFLKYMLNSVKKELEKEYIMHSLSEVVDRKWKAEDYLALEYFISMNMKEKTVLDFVKLFNRFNDKKRCKYIYEEYLLPLIEDQVLSVVRETNKNMFNDNPNLVLKLNNNKLNDINVEKIDKIVL